MAVILAQSSDNKLIGLIAYFIVDDRQTFVRRFERIHQDLRGQGLVRKLREYARNHAKPQTSTIYVYQRQCELSVS